VVSQVKRLLPRKTRIGHTGTLDPLASGLLVLLIGRTTRLSRYITGLDKSYTATACLGAVSDTLDADGNVTSLPDSPLPNEPDLRVATSNFTGEILQTPPMASAVKVGGERLYKLHRRGEEIERQSRSVNVHSFKLLSYDSPTATFAVSCGSGTYVRTLIADLAESLNTGAYLTTLRRTRVGHLTIENAVEPRDLSPDSINFINQRVIQTRDVVSFLPIVEVSARERVAVCNGRKLGSFGLSGSYRVESGGELLAVYRDSGEQARAEVVLCAGTS
jgi:tRNA pseudouridine55 synthase